jgi:hypothetical protein
MAVVMKNTMFIGKKTMFHFSGSYGARHHPHPVLPADHDVLPLPFHDAGGQQVAEEKDFGEGDLHLPDREAELPGPFFVRGAGYQVVEADDLLPLVDPFQEVVLAGIEGPRRG